MKLIVLFIFVLLMPKVWAEEDKDLKELVKAREAFNKSAAAQTGLQIDESLLKLQQLAPQLQNSASLLDKNTRLKLVDAFKTNPFKNFPPFEIRKHFLLVTQGTFMGGIFEKYPDTLNALVAIVKDDKALPGLIQLLIKEKELKIYSGIALSLLIISWLLGKYWLAKDVGFIRRVTSKIILSLSFTTLNFVIFYFMFQTELHPTVSIIKSYI